MAYQWTDLATIRSAMYLNKTDTESDAVLELLILQITDAMITYLDDEDFDNLIPTLDLQRACAQQVTYEYRRREDVGLQSATFHNGNINKYTIDEWLPAVKKILERHKRTHL